MTQPAHHAGAFSALEQVRLRGRISTDRAAIGAYSSVAGFMCAVVDGDYVLDCLYDAGTETYCTVDGRITFSRSGLRLAALD